MYPFDTGSSELVSRVVCRVLISLDLSSVLDPGSLYRGVSKKGIGPGGVPILLNMDLRSLYRGYAPGWRLWVPGVLLGKEPVLAVDKLEGIECLRAIGVRISISISISIIRKYIH